MTVKYGREGRWYIAFIDGDKIHATSLLALRRECAGVLSFRTKKDYQIIYDEIEFV